MTGLLVVAGESSGDRAAAAVLARLAHLPGLRAFGLGGPALARAGCDLVSDLRASTALGVTEVGARAIDVWRSWAAVTGAARSRKPAAALLVDYAEYNARLAARLHREGVRVLWYGPPQVWAWRAARVPRLAPIVDRMAVVLPFEESLWRSAGVDARYVGHPAREVPRLARDEARRLLGMTPRAPAVALLPGSRPHEARRLLGPMLASFERVRLDRASLDARVLVASGLDDETRSWVQTQSHSARVVPFEVDPAMGAAPLLSAFDVALCASGTVTLEAALAGVPPIVVYRVGLATEVVARALVRAPHLALPNVILERRAFDEFVQRDVTVEHLAGALERVLDDPAASRAACAEVDARLGDARTPSLAVAQMLTPWLEGGLR